MNKKYFALKLLPSRPTFAFDMSEEEKAVMNEHVAYWKDLMDKGIALIFGPVLDPAGPYGFGVVAVDEEKQVHEITSRDPASKLNKYEIFPMLAVTPQNKNFHNGKSS